MKEKLDNDVFKITEIDENVLEGDANKLKLLITSYAVIMDVQKAYIEEEISKKNKEQSDLEVALEQGTSDNIEKTKEEINELTKEITILERAAFDFNLSHERFMSLAMKALSLPDKNFKKLAENGYARSKGGTVYLADLQQAVKDSQDSLVDIKKKKGTDGKKVEEKTDIFSSIDTDAIKQGLEKALNEELTDTEYASTYNKYSDYVTDNITSENFKEAVSVMAEGLKNDLDDAKKEDKGKKSSSTEPSQDSAEPASNETDIDENDFDNLLRNVDEQENSIAHEVDDEEDIFSKADRVGTTNPNPATGSIFDTTNTPGSKNETEGKNAQEPENNSEQPIFGDEDNDDFDFSDDPELQELEAQYQEAKGQYESYQAELRQKDEQATKLTTKRDETAQTAEAKKKEADRIIESRRIAARNKRIAQIKAGLSDYKTKAMEAAALVNQANKRIGALNTEIASYQTSIEQSERIIEEEKRTKK